MSELDQEDKGTSAADRAKDTSKQTTSRRATRQQLKEQPRKRSPIAAGGGKTRTSHQASAADAVTPADTR